jgi:hypothetical protein
MKKAETEALECSVFREDFANLIDYGVILRTYRCDPVYSLRRVMGHMCSFRGSYSSYFRTMSHP